MRSSKTLVEAFEGFWAAYPRRPDNPKAAARLVFERRVREGADPAMIVAAAGRYARAQADAKTDAAFIPHARTWLSQRRYEDYAEDAPQDAAGQALATPFHSHPLAWMMNEVGLAAFASWLRPIVVTDDPPTLNFKTGLALQHVRRNWERLLLEHFGDDLVWRGPEGTDR